MGYSPRLNKFNNEFRLNVAFKCVSIIQAIKLRKLLEENKFNLAVKRNNFRCRNKYVEQQAERQAYMLYHLKEKTIQKTTLTKDAISIGRYWNFIKRKYRISPEIYAKDLSLLILQGKIIAWVSANQTMLRLRK